MKKLLTLAVLALLVFTGCEKGPKGDPGNANVIGTNALIYYPGDWTLTQSGLYVSIDAPDVTQDVVDYGTVMGYMQTQSNTWMPMPLTIGNVTFTYSFYPGGIDVDVVGTSTMATAVSFRFVIIPSSVRKANPNADWSNYSQVEQMIKEHKEIKIKDVKPRQLN